MPSGYPFCGPLPPGKPAETIRCPFCTWLAGWDVDRPPAAEEPGILLIAHMTTAHPEIIVEIPDGVEIT